MRVRGVTVYKSRIVVISHSGCDQARRGSSEFNGLRLMENLGTHVGVKPVKERIIPSTVIVMCQARRRRRHPKKPKTRPMQPVFRFNYSRILNSVPATSGLRWITLELVS